MSKIKMLSCFILVTFICFSTIALGDNSIKVNHFKCFKAGTDSDKLLMVSLQADRRTRVQIMVTKKNEVLENYRLVVGPKGVCEGKFKGAQSWSYVLPTGTQGRNREVVVYVNPLAGNGNEVDYEIKALSAENVLGFCKNTL